ncbi:MAG TPA: lipoyl(octanoyl) transferase LipB [Acidobacteriota bacterium]|jgi:lipoate-protein ligase B
MEPVEYISLPVTPYAECWDFQRERVALRQKGGPGAVIFAEHCPVVTLGRSGRRNSLLSSPDQLQQWGVDLVHSDRGGDITYHGPGQLVVYPIFDLAGWKRSIHAYLRALEEVTIRALDEFGICAQRSALGTGIWIEDAGRPQKIGSIGVHISRWVTSHGLALNVSNSLEPFRYIVPCGIQNIEMTSMAQLLGRPVDRSSVEAVLWKHVEATFELKAENYFFDRISKKTKGDHVNVNA